ncbi:MAG: TniQ family protein [Pseudomonadota bacterium]
MLPAQGDPPEAASAPDHAYPVQDNLREGESGHGYVLRMAGENGLLGLPSVKARLGKSRFAVLDMLDAPLLGRWFGADSARLARALGMTTTGSEPDGYEFGGAVLTRSYFINRGLPRICGDCLATSGNCKIAWELSACCACPEHELALIDCCGTCQKALRWDRPGLNECRCGYALTICAGRGVATPEELDVAKWVEDKLTASSCPGVATTLGRLLRPLSLDAGLHVLQALASMHDAHGARSLTAAMRRKNSLVCARSGIAAAARALALLDSGATDLLQRGASTAAIELLAEAASSEYSPADRSLAFSLLAELVRRPRHARWSSRFPQLSQRSLF